MAQGRRILVADDDSSLRNLLTRTFQRSGFDVLSASDGEEALAAARTHLPDLLILDVMMPRLDGFEVCERLRGDPLTSRIPILFVTARREERDVLKGFESGGDEYITKPFSTSQLLARASAMLRRVQQDRDVSPLTGLPGNAAIEQYIQQLLQAEARFALAYADLDHFKGYNDYYGFERGDQALRETTAALKSAAQGMRPPPFIGHLGGDDFVIVLPQEQAEPYAKAALEDFQRRVPGLYDDADRERGHIMTRDRRGNMEQIPLLTLSIGITNSERHPGAPYAELAHYAAECKKRAKSMPGNSLYTDRRRNRPVLLRRGKQSPAIAETDQP
jgi:diguanylate cyclase (GGDEF)-like protein